MEKSESATEERAGPVVKQQTSDNDNNRDSSQFPEWLQPGVSPGIHLGLRIILAMLNTLLFACAAFKVFSPHFEIMFVMSVCLTLLYFQFVFTIETMRKKAEFARRAGGSETAAPDMPAEDAEGNKKDN